VKVVIALVSILLAPIVIPSSSVQAAPAGDDEVIAFVVRGVGNGHGRGLSQWGAYGRSLAGQSWGEILDAYYGGTEFGQRVDPHMRVRLTEWDSSGTLGVVSRGGTARWSGSTTDYTSLYATETTPNVFSVYGVTSGFGCPGQLALVVPAVNLQPGSRGQPVVQLQQFLTYFGYDPEGVDGDFGPLTGVAVERFQADAALAVDGLWRIEEADAAQAMVDSEPGAVDWQPLATGVTGPIVFSTTDDQNDAGPADGLGVCRQSGALIHYRGSIEMHHTSDGNRVVNDLDVENYLRGVLPKEVPAAWGDDGDGNGINALRAQSVAARSFGLSQSRYSYADTCDTSSCQVYGGAALRVSPTTANYLGYETANTDTAILDTTGAVRVWPDGNIVSTEFSASNGPRTAGSAFPPVDDPFDDVPANPNHRWTRIIDADSVSSAYGLSTANGVATRRDRTPFDPPYDGIWANEVQLGQARSPVSAWSFRNAFGLPSPGFELIPIRRDLTDAGSFALIGDSIGVGVVDCCGTNLKTLTEGLFSESRFDALGGRPIVGGSTDGVHAAAKVPIGTDLVVVELGYNDSPSAMGSRIDAMMTQLRSRQVGLVAWVNVSERKSSGGYGVANAAIDAAVSRWDGMVVLDWESASDHARADRWFADGIHLTTTGNAEFALWLRDHIVDLIGDGYTPPQPPRPVVPGVPLRVPVLGVGGVPESGVTGVALNVTAVGPDGPGWLRVWSCGADQPVTSSVNYAVAGAVEPNAVVVPVDATGEVCVTTKAATDVVVDVMAWFDDGLQGVRGDRIVDTRFGIGPIPSR
jgi:peptidoglycan hydrolase-like protein with peptidoglycan-binding domain